MLAPAFETASVSLLLQTAQEAPGLTPADFPSPNAALPCLLTKTLAHIDPTLCAYSMHGATKVFGASFIMGATLVAARTEPSG